jgi:hypothetical protein
MAIPARAAPAAAISRFADAALSSGARYTVEASSIGRTDDVTPDGRRFLMIKPAPSPNFVVVLNWAETLRAEVH